MNNKNRYLQIIRKQNNLITEYQMLLAKNPAVILTTSNEASQRVKQLRKEIKDLKEYKQNVTKEDKTTMINFIDARIIAAEYEIKNGSHHIEVEDAIIYVATRIKEKFIEVYK